MTAWSNRDNFDSDMWIHPAVADEPRQSPVDEPEFTTHANDVDYIVRPKYRYELTGLVVSFKRFSQDYGLHKRWNDFINVADVCVVWGDNATDVDLNAFDFWNGEFTCTFSTRNETAWRRFDKNKLSNNHLITDSPRVREVIEELEVGDQVRFSGWLAEYGEPGGPFRSTSTTRTDTGDGACETVYVADMEIVGSMSTIWRHLVWLSVAGLLVSIVLWFRTPHHQLRR
ncbi:hypothetical protein DZC52_07800 [Wenzhouxiangella sediminis]|uniref:Uncharacterized protein n=1 Tax=Wenzhouxiangella sediminis TaxID=1792836 RepID=A0A3E1K968_9GAMM|nr:hypothetical protein DZC52_07800 [Wenzhouxiangella sediminis]